MVLSSEIAGLFTPSLDSDFFLLNLLIVVSKDLYKITY